MPDNRLKAFVNTIKNTDSDEVILDAVKSEYFAEIGSAVNLGKDILDKAKNKFHDLKKDSKQLDNPEEQTTPTFQREQFGNQLQKTERDAVSTVMRPDVPEYNKKSKLFKDLDYSVGADGVTAVKDVNGNTDITASLDIFDKSAGLGFAKQLDGERTKISGSIEYEPLDNAIEGNAGYNDGRNNLTGSIYLKEGNPGISADFAKTINSKTTINVSASVFKSDAAFKAEFDTKLKDNTNLSVGAYGSTKYKEIGVTARMWF